MNIQIKKPDRGEWWGWEIEVELTGLDLVMIAALLWIVIRVA